MSDSWHIKIGGRSYGPYNLQQMRGFVMDGRLATHSQVTRQDSDALCVAKDDELLAHLFEPTKNLQQIPSATGRFYTAKRSNDDSNTQSFGRSNEDGHSGERGRYLIIADMKSRSISGLEELILNLGPAYALFPQIWLLVSDQTINAI